MIKEVKSERLEIANPLGKKNKDWKTTAAAAASRVAAVVVVVAAAAAVVVVVVSATVTATYTK